MGERSHLNVYTLGQFGVNRNKSPIQARDGELLHAQNAQPRPYRREITLSTRDGMDPINHTPLAGPVLSLSSVPFRDPSVPLRIWADGYTDMLRSANGTLFTPQFTAQVQDTSLRPLTFGPLGRLYWDQGSGVLRQYDLTTASTVSAGPTRDQFYQLLYDPDADLLWMNYFTPTVPHEVASWDGSTWTALSVLPFTATGSGALGQIPFGSHAGHIIIGGQNNGAPDFTNAIMRWDGAAWQTDLVLPSSVHLIRYFCAWDDRIVALLGRASGTTAIPLVRLRATDGTWSDITPTGLTFPSLMLTGCEHDGDLYIAWRRVDFARVEIYRYDGVDWTLDLDLVVEGTGLTSAPTNLASIGGRLYCGLIKDNTLDYILVKTGSTWARLTVDDGASHFAVEP